MYFLVHALDEYAVAIDAENQDWVDA